MYETKAQAEHPTYQEDRGQGQGKGQARIAMPKFEKYLNVSKDPEWANFYIGYGQLKEVLKASVERQHFAAATLRRARSVSAGWGLQTQNIQETWNLDNSAHSTSAASEDETFSKVRTKEWRPNRADREIQTDSSTKGSTHHPILVHVLRD